MLTKEEAQELAALEAEEMTERMAQDVSNGLTPEEQQELEMLEAEEMEASKPQVQPYEEASLGFGLRSQYALEPLESNRVALLKRELGEENVMQDDKGEVFVNVDGAFKPVNVEGISVADLADLAGTIPEMAGTAAGAVAGLGAGSVPAAVAGGALGSAARQGLSALVGTPQVADIGERALETGISAAAGGIGAGIGKGIAKLGKKIVPQETIDKAFKSSAKKVGLNLTKAQKLGKESADLEKAIAEVPLLGRNARKRLNSQIAEIKSNVAKQFPDFQDLDYDRLGEGFAVKEKSRQFNKALKSQASELFDSVASQGKDVVVDSESVVKSLSKNLKDIGIVDAKGNPLKYNVKSGFTRDQFGKVQQVTTDIVDAINETAKANDGVIDANMLNTLRKSIDSNIKEVGKMGFDDAALLRLREGFMSLTEDMLGSKSPKLKSEFKQARALYKKYLDNREVIDKTFRFDGKKEVSDELAVGQIFKNTKTLNEFIKLTDETTAKDAANKHLRDVLSKKLGKNKQVSATGAIKVLRDRREMFKKAFGPKDYQNLMDNLVTLEQLGESINPSKTGILDLQTNIVKGLSTAGQFGLSKASKGAGEALQKAGGSILPAATYAPTKKTLNEILRGE